jgi:hypothetical protein
MSDRFEGTAMALIQRLLDKLKRKPPVISTAWGDVPEKARLQAETNLRLDPAKRASVLAILVKEAKGDEEAGKREFRRRYPRGGEV